MEHEWMERADFSASYSFSERQSMHMGTVQVHIIFRNSLES